MTNHTIETAPSGRSKCRGCGRPIGKGEQRFGERLPNPFGDGDMTHWHHPLCAAHRRPDSLLALLEDPDHDAAAFEQLRAICEAAISSPRLQRLGVAEPASSSRARCRHCKELIEKDTWRLPLVFFEDDTYNQSGFIHAACVAAYCDTDNVEQTVLAFAEAENAAAISKALKP